MGRKTNLVGLDIGSSLIKMVKLKKEGSHLKIVAGDIESNPLEESLPEGEKNLELLSDTIRGMHRKNNFNVRNVATSIGGDTIITEYLEFPPLTTEELEGAVRIEAEQITHSDFENTEIDYQVLPSGKKKDKINVLLVAVSKEIVQKKVQLVEQAKLNPLIMDVDSLALVNCFLEIEHFEDSKNILLLNIGAKYTTIAIIGKDSLPFTRNISFGGNNITDRLAKRLNISFTEAENIKTHPSLWEKQTLNIKEITEEGSLTFFEEIHRSLRYFKTKAANSKVDKILITGGSSKLELWKGILPEKIGLPVEVWNPLDRVEIESGSITSDLTREVGHFLPVAIGLALKEWN